MREWIQEEHREHKMYAGADGEAIPETINAKTSFPQPNLPEAEMAESQLGESQEETPAQLSGTLHKTEIQTINEQWKDENAILVFSSSINT